MRFRVKPVHTLDPLRNKLTIFLTVMLLVLFWSFMISRGSVNAVEPTANDPIKTYCLSLKITSQAARACYDEANIKHARMVATYHCDGGASLATQEKCYIGKAKSYFKDAAAKKPKPKTEKAFVDALNDVLEKAGGSTKVPAKGSGGSLAPNDGTSCANGTCPGVNSDPEEACKYDNHCDLIKKYINPGINLLTMIFGLIATGSLILGGIQYSASEGDPNKAGQAKNRIANTIFAIIAYFFLYGFLQFLIPGGKFN